MSDSGGAKQGGGYLGSKPNAWQRKPAIGGGGNAAATKTTTTESVGRCDELRGHMFDCGQPKHADMYNTTVEEIINHVRVSFGEGDLVARAISSGKKVVIRKPIKPEKITLDDGTELEVDETDLEIWRAEIKDYVRTKRNYDSALQKTYGLVIGQCTQNLKANLESIDDYADIGAEADVLRLLAAIKSLVFNFESTKCLADALVGSLRAFYRFTQPKTMSDEEFLKKYKSMYEVIVQSGGRIGYHPAMILKQLTKLGIAATDGAGVMGALDQCVAASEEEFSAVHFLRMLNWERHGSLVTHLENQYTLGIDAYPKTLTAAYNLAIKWKKDTRGTSTPTTTKNPKRESPFSPTSRKERSAI